MKILITGGAGFIGSHFSEFLLEKGNEVVVLDNFLRGNKLSEAVASKLTLIKGDACDYQTVLNAAKGCDVVYHFAAVLGVDVVAEMPVETMEVEVISTRNVTKACLELGIQRMIYASTSGIYGHSHVEDAVTEDIMVDPQTSYAAAKRYNEIYLRSVHETKGLNVICVRFFNIYGANQDDRMVIPRFIRQALNHEDITVYGDGTQTRDFTHVNDCCTAIYELLKHDGFEIVNVCHSKEQSIGDLARTIKEVTNSKSEIIFKEPGDKRLLYEVKRRYGSPEKLRSLIGFVPETPLDTGLLQIIKEKYATSVR